MTDAGADAERTLRILRIAGGLGTLGLAVQALVESPSGPPRAHLIAMAVCGAIWLWALLRRSPPPIRITNAVFLALMATIIVSLTASTQKIAESGINWVPFRAHQLGALAIALLAPPVWTVGVVAIIAMIGAAVIQFMLFGPEIREHLPYGDPWSTIIFGGFAMGLLFYRVRADRIEREAVRTQAEAESYQRFARAMIAVRDLSNTPLQTLVNIITLLRQRGPELGETADRLERAVIRLTDLERATRPFEGDLEWRSGDESLDPRAILQMESLRQ